MDVIVEALERGILRILPAKTFFTSCLVQRSDGLPRTVATCYGFYKSLTTSIFDSRIATILAAIFFTFLPVKLII